MLRCLCFNLIASFFLIPLGTLAQAQTTLQIPTFLAAENSPPTASLLQDETQLAPVDALSFLNWTLSPATEVSTDPVFLLPKRSFASTSDARIQPAYLIFADVPIDRVKLEKLERYRQALQVNDQSACGEFQALSEDPGFDHRDFAKLRFWTLCPALINSDGSVEDVDITERPFMAEMKASAQMVVTERAEKWDIYLQLLFEKAQNSRALREKTKTLEMGLQVAELKNRPTDVVRFRHELERMAPRFIQKPKPEDFLSVGQDWIMVREFDKGRSYLRKALRTKKASFHVQRKAYQSLRNSYKVEQNKAKHLAESENFFRWLVKNKEWSLAFDSGLYWIRALWTDGQKSRAEKEIKNLEKQFAAQINIRSRAYELEFIRGRMDEEDSAYEKALAHYDAALKMGGEGSSQEVKVASARGWVLRRLGRDLDAAAEFERIAALALDLPDQLRARFWQAKSLMRAGQSEKAIAVFRQVAYDDPVGYYGLVAFHELASEIPPLDIPREKSLKGWNNFSVENAKATALDVVSEQAIDMMMESLGEVPPPGETASEFPEPMTSSERHIASPWGAQVLMASMDQSPNRLTTDPAPGIAGVAPTGALVLAPTGGLLSEPPRALISGSVRKKGLPDFAKSARSLSTEEKIWISDLHLMGEKQVLQKYLDGISSDPSWNFASEQGLQLLKSYARSGLYLPLFATIGKIEKEQRESLLMSHPELLFPMDFGDQIQQAAQQEDIPKELVFSIIRQESAFDPNARSFADAMGLMQILPTQAQNVAKDLKLEWTGHDDLFRPELNIPVGARMLRQGLSRYDGNFILAIASYNANDKAIKGWLKTRFRDDPVEFIEEIAYEETRSYVKLVLRNYIFYKRLSNPSLALSFPPECLPNLRKFKGPDRGASAQVQAQPESL